VLCSGPRAFSFNGLGGSAEVTLHLAFFAGGETLAEDVLIFGVGLGKIAEAETLGEFQVATAFGVALDDQLNTPFDFRGRALTAAAKEHVVFDFELADVAFELTQFFVDGGHRERAGP